MADHRLRFNAPAAPQFSQGIFNHEECGLRERGLPQPIGCGLALSFIRIDHLADIQPQDRIEMGCALIHGSAKDRFKPVEVSAHIRILRALPRKHKHHRSGLGFMVAGQHLIRRQCVQGRNRFFQALTHQQAAVIKALAPHLQRIGNIGQGQIRVLLQMA